MRYDTINSDKKYKAQVEFYDSKFGKEILFIDVARNNNNAQEL